MLDAGYVREKLGKVVEILTSVEADERSRLTDALLELNALVSFSPWKADPATESIRPEIEGIVAVFSSPRPHEGEGLIAAHVKALSEQQLTEWGWKVVTFARKAHAEPV